MILPAAKPLEIRATLQSYDFLNFQMYGNNLDIAVSYTLQYKEK